jgi:hypothetical protein
MSKQTTDFLQRAHFGSRAPPSPRTGPLTQGPPEGTAGARQGLGRRSAAAGRGQRLGRPAPPPGRLAISGLEVFSVGEAAARRQRSNLSNSQRAHCDFTAEMYWIRSISRLAPWVGASETSSRPRRALQLCLMIDASYMSFLSMHMREIMPCRDHMRSTSDSPWRPTQIDILKMRPRMSLIQEAAKLKRLEHE